MKKILFDFDGVLVDSAREMLIPAYSAAVGVDVAGPEDLPEGYAESYLLNRPYLRPASEAIPLAKLALALADPRQVSLEEWKAALESETVPAEERLNSFFAARTRLMNLDRKRWVSFNKPYGQVWSELQKFPERVIILTNKNRAAVLEIIGHFNLAVPEDQIFTGDNSRTKKQNLGDIRERFGDTRYTFLEDSLENLLEVRDFAPETIHPLLANWGYVTQEDLAQAQRLGIEVVSQEGFIESYL